MRVQFDETLDDMVEVAFRMCSRSRKVRSWRITARIAASILMGFVAWLTMFVLIPEVREPRLIIAGLGAAMGGLLYPLTYRRILKRRLRGYYREQLGDHASFPVQVELSPEGIHTKQIGSQITFEWAQINKIQQTSDSIDFFTRHGGIAVVWKRAFASEESIGHFIEEANRYLDQSQGVSGALGCLLSKTKPPPPLSPPIS